MLHVTFSNKANVSNLSIQMVSHYDVLSFKVEGKDIVTYSKKKPTPMFGFFFSIGENSKFC